MNSETNFTARIPSSAESALIDAALARLASAEPPTGLAERIGDRLHAGSVHSGRGGLRLLHFSVRTRVIAATLAAGLAAAGAALAVHSHATQKGVLPPPVAAGSGFGAAGAVRVPTQPVSASTDADPAAAPASHRHGRSAVQARGAHRQGMAVPHTPPPADTEP